ncbi:hypothetical protein [Bacillus cereus]|uniref:hypothetical protein n=1 Tax=Bacillus cereus group TaxID=86661 RepID=UPI001BA59EAC|nr:hypothetical protein [Bacillus cereus]MBR9655779.1 hypothetical protein [Bacillus cereus]
MRCRECGKLTCINRSACRRKADEARRREVERNYPSSHDLTSPSYQPSYWGGSSYGSCGSSSDSYGSSSSSYGSSSDSCGSGSWD